ncbi:hypothetical protein D5400_02095 [Georhizobium profundi]|uniref:Methylaspartate ammonia-lyase n=1 Tax=Georhizobium profundi TaxID=2341112 RepID=A0A3S9AZV4_9HYPH|nr:hypothetical protein [Georhizobium profundi]AZN70227.1 hypothetical protein D5400_02095 [Georhizobium profundi]
MAPRAPLQPRSWLHSPAVRAAQAGAGLVLCAMIASPFTNSARAQEPLDAGSSMREQVACSACAALEAMMPAGEGPFFYRSFEPANAGSRLHPSLENTAFTYDNALAAMALYACDRAEKARRVVDALIVAQATDRHYSDGRLRNAYRSGPVSQAEESILLPGYWDAGANQWIEDGYQVGSATGSTAWGALAFLTAFAEENEPVFRQAAVDVMAWVNTQTRDPLGKGYFGGFFGHEPAPQLQTWKSTEHNIDVYAANRWLEDLDGGAQWAEAAESADVLLEAMWRPDTGSLHIGTLPDSDAPNLTSSGLDAQLWAPIGTDRFADRTDEIMAWTEDNHGIGEGTVSGFDFNDDRDGIWLEGTAQAALTYRLTGAAEKAEPLFATIAENFAPNGLVYATADEELTTGLSVGPASEPGDFKYYRLPHVGATAWAALAALDWNPFTGRRESAATPLEPPACLPKP